MDKEYNIYVYLCVKYNNNNYVDFLIETINYTIENNIDIIKLKLKEQYNKKLYTKEDTWLINNLNNIDKYVTILINTGIPMENVLYIEQYHILKSIKEVEENDSLNNYHVEEYHKKIFM